MRLSPASCTRLRAPLETNERPFTARVVGAYVANFRAFGSRATNKVDGMPNRVASIHFSAANGRGVSSFGWGFMLATSTATPQPARMTYAESPPSRIYDIMKYKDDIRRHRSLMSSIG